ncbi:protein suppressor of hairy wing-like protein, partial [Lasius niger]
MEKIEIVKIEECPDDILIEGTTTEILFDANTSDIQIEDQPILVDCRPHTDVKVISENGQIISIITDYECVTCHRIFQSEDMLKEHLDMCREEDDSTNIMEFNNMENYDSEDDEEDEDDPLSNEDSDSKSQKNNNEKLQPVIKPVPETQCHCCAEDLKTAHSGGEFKCPHCNLSFKKKSSLERHDIVIHWKCDSCTCNECGSSFRDKKALNKHRYTTHGDRKIF